MQADPTQLACQTLPELSWQEVCEVTTPLGPPPPLPEQIPAPPPLGRGMEGHTLAGEQVVPVGLPPDELVPPLLLLLPLDDAAAPRHDCRDCCWESQPVNWKPPVAPHTIGADTTH